MQSTGDTDGDGISGVPRAARIGVWVLVVIGLAIRVYGNWWDYPLVLHPDESKIVGRAFTMLSTRQVFTEFLNYPTVSLYLNMLVFGVIGLVNKVLGILGLSRQGFLGLYFGNSSVFHIISRSMTACLGAASIGVVWKIGRRLFDWRAGIAAAGFMAVAYRHVLDSHFATTDVPATFFMLVVIYLSLPILEGQARSRDYILAGVMAGLAAATKYPAGLVLIVPMVAHFLLRPPAEENDQGSWHMGAVCIGSAVVGFVVGCPSAVRLWDHFGLALLAESIHAQAGHLGARPGTFFGYFTHLQPAGGVGWTIVATAVVGLLWGFFKAPRRLAFVSVFPIIYYLLIGSRNLQISRYIVMLGPFFALWAGIAIAYLHTEFMAINGHRSGWIFVALMVAVPGLMASTWIGPAALAQENTNLETKQWVKANIPPNENILLFGSNTIPLSDDRITVAQETYNDMYALQYRVAVRWLKALRDTPLGRWKAQWVNQKIDEYEQAATEFETIAESRAPRLDTLCDESCNWSIIRSDWKQKFYKHWTVAQYPEMTASWQRLLERVEAQGTRRFKSTPGPYSHPWGLGFMRNPTFVVYRLDEEA